MISSSCSAAWKQSLSRAQSQTSLNLPSSCLSSLQRKLKFCMFSLGRALAVRARLLSRSTQTGKCALHFHSQHANLLDLRDPRLWFGFAFWALTPRDHELRCELPFGQCAQGQAAEVILESQLKAKGLGVKTQVRMHSFVATGAKTDVRVVDIIDSAGVFHEVKSGNISYNQTILNQILKDIGILKNNPDCKGYIWHFFPGKNGTPVIDQKVLTMLKENGIDFVIHDDMSSEATGSASEEEESTIEEATDEGVFQMRWKSVLIASLCCFGFGAFWIFRFLK